MALTGRRRARGAAAGPRWPGEQLAELLAEPGGDAPLADPAGRAGQRCRPPNSPACAHAGRRRRGVPGRAGGALVGRTRGWSTPTGPPRRPSAPPSSAPAVARARRPADRPPGARTPGCTCWTAALRPVPAGRAGRAVHRGRGAGPRLPQPARADRRALRRQPVRPRGIADVPHRRPRRAGRRTAAATSSAAPTTRSRSAASGSNSARSRPCWPAHPAVGQGGRRRPRGPAGPPAGSSPTWCRRRRLAAAPDPAALRRHVGARAAGLHGAGRRRRRWTRCR